MRVHGLWLLLAACGGLDVLNPEVRPEGPLTARAELRGVPLMGGTLEVVPALDRVVAAIPEADRLVVADPIGNTAVPIALGAGTRPFRVAVDELEAFVTLRGTGEVVRVDLTGLAVDWRTAVCADPRGVAVDGDRILVACAGGELVALDRDGAVVDRVFTPSDLRDVVVTSGATFVSRFRTAEVLRFDRDSLERVGRSDFGGGRVAWRMRAADDGDGVVVVYQDEPPPPPDLPPTDVPTEYYASPPVPCGSAGHPRIGTVRDDGEVRAGAWLDRVVLPADLWVGSDGVIVVDGAGPTNSTAAVVYDGARVLAEQPETCARGEPRLYSGFDHPSAVVELHGELVLQAAGRPLLFGRDYLVSLEVDPDELAGFATFHRDPGSGVACATCHPEGLDDGRVRELEPPAVAIEGPRRTMDLAGGVADRAPFHWYGDDPTFADLVADTYVRGMGGPADVDSYALLDWLDAVPAVRGTPADPAAADRGAAVFGAVGCARCHNGSQYANGVIADVGRGPLKVPSLVGLGTRAPLMHDGCAATIEDRLRGPESCSGGAAHGDLTGLTAGEIDDLAAFLGSL